MFIPETQETVKAHPKFMLYATQNPPGQYGGRKVRILSYKLRVLTNSILCNRKDIVKIIVKEFVHILACPESCILAMIFILMDMQVLI